jgi:hypothetical protein
MALAFGLDHKVGGVKEWPSSSADAPSHTCCLLQPTQAELDSCKLLIAVARASGDPQAQVVTLG